MFFKITVGNTQIVMRLRIIRPDPQGLGVAGYSLIILPDRAQAIAQIVKRLGILRIDR